MDIDVGDNFGDVDALESNSQYLRLEKNSKCQQRKWPNRLPTNDHQHFVTNICYQHRFCETFHRMQSKDYSNIVSPVDVLNAENHG